MLEKSVCQYGHRHIIFRDDTLTVNKKWALEICQGIIMRRLNFIWSCDTRVDKLDEELLYFMRLAGCQRLSFGVESASPLILKNIKKHITPELVAEITRSARKFGFQIRYYIMAGNRGETMDTFQETLNFIEEARPNQVYTSKLSIFPGTEEFKIIQAAGLSPEIFFKEDFFYLHKFAGRPQDEKLVFDLMKENDTLEQVIHYSAEELRAILEIFPHSAAAHLDLAGAYVREAEYDQAEEQVRLALELDYPYPGLALNYLACIAAARHDYAGVMAYLFKAQLSYPHAVVMQNMEIFQRWLKERGQEKGLPLQLTAHNFFESNYIFQQPETPGPIILTLKDGKEYRLGPEESRAEPLLIQA
jgi:tetratricopeptide (TPR) repeat protein